MTVRVAIADDHVFFRESLLAFLSSVPGVVVVGEADSGESLVQIVSTHQVDIAMLDIHLHGGGLATIRKLVPPPLNCRCVVVSLDATPETVRRAINEGAVGYMLKESLEQELPAALGLVASGGMAFSGGVKNAIRLPPYGCPVRLFPQLTNRESDVLRELAKGATNGEIAETLFLSPKTVANHISIILEKLDEPDRAALIRKAREFGAV